MFKALSNYLRSIKLFNPINLEAKYPKDFLALMKSANDKELFLKYLVACKSEFSYEDYCYLDATHYEYKVRLKANQLCKFYIAGTISYPDGFIVFNCKYSPL